ncbi:MAG: hypothetical protein AAB492_02355 [Patescibacteria group bacterium]
MASKIDVDKAAIPDPRYPKSLSARATRALHHALHVLDNLRTEATAGLGATGEEIHSASKEVDLTTIQANMARRSSRGIWKPQGHFAKN